MPEFAQMELPIANSLAVVQFRPAIAVESDRVRAWDVQVWPMQASLYWPVIAAPAYGSFGIVLALDEPVGPSVAPPPFNAFVGGFLSVIGPRGLRLQVTARSVQVQMIAFALVTSQQRVMFQAVRSDGTYRRETIPMGLVASPARSLPRFTQEYRLREVTGAGPGPGTHNFVAADGTVIEGPIPNLDAAEWRMMHPYAAGIVVAAGPDIMVETR